MSHVVKLHFQTDPVLLRIVRKQIVAAASAVGAMEHDVARVELAVGEALANAHDHGYGGTPGPIELEIAYEPHRFAVTVHDEGPGLPLGPQFPDPPDPRTGTGYGLQVIKELMDEAELQYSGPKGRGTTVRMAIRLR
jgi:serine/threonine-protein kinase RsbW